MRVLEKLTIATPKELIEITCERCDVPKTSHDIRETAPS
jgi:hypothetical protein